MLIVEIRPKNPSLKQNKDGFIGNQICYCVMKHGLNKVSTHSKVKSIEAFVSFVSNVMKSKRLSDPFLAEKILFQREVYLSIQLPVPLRSACVHVRAWACVRVCESEPVLVTHKGYITQFCSCSLQSSCSPSLNHPISRCPERLTESVLISDRLSLSSPSPSVCSLAIAGRCSSALLVFKKKII